MAKTKTLIGELVLDFHDPHSARKGSVQILVKQWNENNSKAKMELSSDGEKWRLQVFEEKDAINE